MDVEGAVEVGPGDLAHLGDVDGGLLLLELAGDRGADQGAPHVLLHDGQLVAGRRRPEDVAEPDGRLVARLGQQHELGLGVEVGAELRVRQPQRDRRRLPPRDLRLVEVRHGCEVVRAVPLAGQGDGGGERLLGVGVALLLDQGVAPARESLEPVVGGGRLAGEDRVERGRRARPRPLLGQDGRDAHGGVDGVARAAGDADDVLVAGDGPLRVCLALVGEPGVEQRRHHQRGGGELGDDPVVELERLVPALAIERGPCLVEEVAGVVDLHFGLAGCSVLHHLDPERVDIDRLLGREPRGRCPRGRGGGCRRRGSTRVPRTCSYKHENEQRGAVSAQRPHRYPATTRTSTRRSRGPSNSQKKTACQFPSCSRPPSTMKVSAGPTRLPLM